VLASTFTPLIFTTDFQHPLLHFSKRIDTGTTIFQIMQHNPTCAESQT